MRVNSACKGLFRNHVAIVTIATLVVFCVTSSFTTRPDRDVWAKQVNLMIRQIGHRLLLQAGDSTSRVLPVTEIKEGTFQLSFENELFFNHDSLIALSHNFLPKEQFPSGYTVTIHECTKDFIAYGFQLNNISPDIIACEGRSQPPGCYTIEIVFPDLYKVIKKQRKARVHEPIKEPKPAKADNPEPNPVAKEIKLTPLQSEPPIIAQSNQTYPIVSLVLSGMLVLLSVTLLIGRFGKNSKPAPVQDPDHSILIEPAPTPASLGKFVVDLKGRRLLLDDEVISLTDKECQILELLNQNFGELIPRETLMQKVWINEGVITGRSLDMFISKLRKKLSSDPGLRITNVHGKGYKLEQS